MGVENNHYFTVAVGGVMISVDEKMGGTIFGRQYRVLNNSLHFSLSKTFVWLCLLWLSVTDEKLLLSSHCCCEVISHCDVQRWFAPGFSDPNKY